MGFYELMGKPITQNISVHNATVRSALGVMLEKNIIL